MRSSSSTPLAASLVATTDKENATHVIELAQSQSSSPSSRPADALCRRKRTDDALKATADRRRRRRPDHTARPSYSSERNVHADTPSRSPRSSLALGSSTTVSFQRRLARPREVPAISHSNLSLMVSHAGCSGQSLADIKYLLRTRATQMATALRAVRAAPTSTLPQSLDALVPTEHIQHMPSHFLAVYSRSPANRLQGRRAVTLFPAHDVVLAAYCAKLAPLGAPAVVPDYNAHCGPDGRSFDVSIPVVPLCLPSPRTFGILQHYLYHHTTDALAQALLPAIPATITGAEDRAQTIRLLSQQIAAVHGPAKINEHVLQAHGLWSNMVVLGISDEALWDALDFFWEILMDALYIATLVRPDENTLLGSAAAALQSTSVGPTTRNADHHSNSSGAESDSDTGCTSDSSRTTSPPTSPLLSKAVQAMDLY